MSVTKHTNVDVYSVRNRGEWATIVVREWSDQREDGSEQHRGEILINSTFGSWAHYWGAPGTRFRRFLLGLDFGYAFGKFMGLALEQYDGDASMAGLQRKVIESRRRRHISREAARFVWDQIDDHSSELRESQESFITACGHIGRECDAPWARRAISTMELDDIGEIFAEPWYLTETRDHPQAVGFWRDIWPEFCAALRAELEAEKEPA